MTLESGNPGEVERLKVTPDMHTHAARFTAELLSARQKAITEGNEQDENSLLPLRRVSKFIEGAEGDK